MIVLFPATLDVRFHRYEKGVAWQVLATFPVITNPHTTEQRIILVPSGQITDFASVPRMPFIYLAYANKAHLPALPHDYLYGVGGTQADKDFADLVFLYGMLQTGESEEDAQAMYAAVRIAGNAHFNWRLPA